MPITLKDIREKEFTTQKNGYAIGEVDDFLEEVAAQVEELLKQNIALKGELQAAKSAPAPEPVVIEKEPEKPALDDSDYFRDLQKAMRESLINANRIAEETRQKAQKDAESAVAAAKTSAEAIVADAKAEADATKAESQALKEAISKYRSDFRALVEEQMKALKTRESLFD